VLAAVFLLIAVRQVGRFSIRIWQIMLVGALAVLVTGQIAPRDAFRAINPDIMVFLFGMFIVGKAMADSGYLSCVANRFFSRAKNPDQVVLFILLGMGFLSAVLMNDTIAIIGTPLVSADTVVIGTEAGNVYFVDITGKNLRPIAVPGKIYASPVAAGNLVLIAPTAGTATLVALDQTGTVKWSFIPAK